MKGNKCKLKEFYKDLPKGLELRIASDFYRSYEGGVFILCTDPDGNFYHIPSELLQLRYS